MRTKIKKPKAIVMDIEGTTSSINFVSKELFPYVRNNLKEYFRSNWNEEELKVTVDRLKQQQQKDSKEGLSAPQILETGSDSEIIDSLINNVIWQMNNKRKNTALKQLQILVWVYGYEHKHLQGHVFEDVPPALNRWKNELDMQLYVYSAGMMIAQQLLFSCSTEGNLQPLFDDFFDSSMGSKTDPESFRRISAKLQINTTEILFLTDNINEANASAKAGCITILVSRPGNKKISAEEKKIFPVIDSFEEIEFA